MNKLVRLYTGEDSSQNSIARQILHSEKIEFQEVGTTSYQQARFDTPFVECEWGRRFGVKEIQTLPIFLRRLDF